MQPACKSTMIHGQNLVLPQGLDLQRCPMSRELEHKNSLIPSYAQWGGGGGGGGGRWGMTLIGALSITGSSPIVQGG